MRGIKRKHTGLLYLILAVFILTGPLAGAQSGIWPFGKKAKKNDGAQAPQMSEYREFVEGAEASENGFINLYIDNGKVYFEIPDDIIGRDLLLGSTVSSTSDNANGIVGGKDRLLHFTFTKSPDHIQLRKIDASYAGSEPNIQKALSASHTGAILYNFGIDSRSDDNSSSVIDVTDLFLSDDLPELSPFLDNSLYSDYDRSSSFRRDNSFISGIKAFDDNISVTSTLSYSLSVRTEQGITVSARGPFTAKVTRSVILLPKEVYKARVADPRIGYFHTDRKIASSLASSTRTVSLVNRWDLVPKDTEAFRRGELTEPVKPITFYIDSNFPEWWKPYIRQAVEMWNRPFERIGFKNAVVALDFPSEDSQFDPDNIKYTCIRYAPVGIRNAMGPSWVDPRSGEIINASVYIFHDVIELLQEWLTVQTGHADPRVRTADIPKDILGDALCYVVRHEIGHTLGLMHNMGASATFPTDSLRSPAFTSKYGTTPSIMDYARFNYVSGIGSAKDGVRMTPVDFGPYDYWAIRWGYTPLFGEDDIMKEADITSGWITDSLKVSSVYRYGKQQSGAGFFDPRNQSEDLGDNAVLASRYGIENLKYVSENFMSWYSQDDDPDFDRRISVFKAIRSQYSNYVHHIAMNVGGIFIDQTGRGNASERISSVPASRQKEALRMLMDMAEDLDWMDSKDILAVIPSEGLPSFKAREEILDGIMTTPLYASLSDGVISNEFSSEDCLDMIWDFAWTGRSVLDSKARQIQSAFVDSLLEMGGFQSKTSSSRSLTGAYDGIGLGYQKKSDFNKGDLSKAVIYSYLVRTRDHIRKTMNTYSGTQKAHLELLLSRIENAIK